MNIGEAALICSGLALLQVQNEKFIADLSDIIAQNLKEAVPIDLILLTKGSFYMRKFKHTEKLYAKVHAQCISKMNLNELDKQEVHILTTMFT